ncbi:hypothetical protein M885DRAFT_577513 [Pelagophyceae sp. CCMP2097]|nr:hypothetical protein M885DRAFT_577513 [Pelagophyceae sp. CCMP2097]
MAWAFSAVRISAPALFETVAKLFTNRMIKDLSPTHLADLSWAYATAGVQAPALFQALARSACQHIQGKETFQGNDLATLIWSFSTIGFSVNHSEQLYIAAAEVFSDTLGGMNAAGRSLLWDVHRDLRQRPQQVEHIGLHVEYLAVLLKAYKNEIKSAFVRTRPPLSTDALEALEMLEGIGWLHEAEFEMIFEGYFVDAAHSESYTYIDFLGPDKFLTAADGARLLDGAAAAKERQLLGKGWRVLYVSYFEWDALQTTEDRIAYLRDKVEPEVIA